MTYYFYSNCRWYYFI